MIFCPKDGMLKVYSDNYVKSIEIVFYNNDFEAPFFANEGFIRFSCCISDDTFRELIEFFKSDKVSERYWIEYIWRGHLILGKKYYVESKLKNLKLVENSNCLSFCFKGKILENYFIECFD